MKVHLLFRGRDFDLQQNLPPHEPDLTQDLGLHNLFDAMAGGDEFLYRVAKQAVLTSFSIDIETILYRQAILQDCLRNTASIKHLYDLAVETIEGERKHWWSRASRSPSGVLFGAVESLHRFMGILTKLKRMADEYAGHFKSTGFTAFFKMIQEELADEYLASIKTHIKQLKFREGVLVSAKLGKGNVGTNYVLRQPQWRRTNWFRLIFSRRLSAYTYRIADRDEAGARILSEMRDQGINLVANAAAQSADHILSFFILLRTELAFYLGCVNLHRTLVQKGIPLSFPVPAPPNSQRHSCVGLRDIGLALTLDHGVVGNDLNAEGMRLVLITGANQGGKSTFLRSIGLAQLMMQSGMFVAAESFEAEICRGLFTHFKREEDATMECGKLDEELKRMNFIVESLTPDSMLLFNESFAATNEKEGSEIARQIIRALLETRVKIFIVTHLYEFALSFCENRMNHIHFLRAERESDGTRTFKLLPGKPLPTSFSADLYEEIFGNGEEHPQSSDLCG